MYVVQTSFGLIEQSEVPTAVAAAPTTVAIPFHMNRSGWPLLAGGNKSYSTLGTHLQVGARKVSQSLNNVWFG